MTATCCKIGSKRIQFGISPYTTRFSPRKDTPSRSVPSKNIIVIIPDQDWESFVNNSSLPTPSSSSANLRSTTAAVDARPSQLERHTERGLSYERPRTNKPGRSNSMREYIKYKTMQWHQMCVWSKKTRPGWGSNFPRRYKYKMKNGQYQRWLLQAQALSTLLDRTECQVEHCWKDDAITSATLVWYSREAHQTAFSTSKLTWGQRFLQVSFQLVAWTA